MRFSIPKRRILYLWNSSYYIYFRQEIYTYNMKTIVVTGGAGFIGSNFIHYKLKTSSDRIICIDSLTYAGNIQNIPTDGKYQNFLFQKQDITNESAIDLIFKKEKPNIVINFAAESHVDRSIDNPYPFLSTNIKGTVYGRDIYNECDSVWFKFKPKDYYQEKDTVVKYSGPAKYVIKLNKK